MRDIINSLQGGYNILVLYHPSTPDDKKVFVVKAFTPVQNSISYLDLRGQDITELLSDTSFWTQFSMGRQTGTSNTEFQQAQFETKLNDIPTRHYQFSPSYVWEWYLNA